MIASAVFLAAMTWVGMTTASTAAEPLKVQFLYLGPIGDHGWTYQHHQGLLAIKDFFGDKIEVNYIENVPEDASSQRVMERLAASGTGLIFSTSFGYMDPTVRAAKKFPKVRFEHATGYKREPNVSTYSARFYEGRHVVGLIVGNMTKSNIIGYVASFPIPEVVRGINATTLAARSVNPKAQTRVIWVSSWFDPGREAEAAKVLIDQGADVIMQHTDSPAPVQVAEDRGVWAIGQATDMHQFGSKAHLTAIINNWDPYYIRRVQATLDDTWKSEDFWGGFSEGTVKMAPFSSDIPANVRSLAEKAVADLTAKKVHPFTGPIRDQSGMIRVKAGEVADDGMLAGMNFYVEGVVGELPSQ